MASFHPESTGSKTEQGQVGSTGVCGALWQLHYVPGVPLTRAALESLLDPAAALLLPPHHSHGNKPVILKPEATRCACDGATRGGAAGQVLTLKGPE